MTKSEKKEQEKVSSEDKNASKKDEQKEKQEAFEFGGFNFAAESLLLIDNIDPVSYTHLTLPTPPYV